MILCPNAPHGPRDCGMVAVQVDEDGNRWTCTLCFEAQRHNKDGQHDAQKEQGQGSQPGQA